jgi:hypothetical protein
MQRLHFCFVLVSIHAFVFFPVRLGRNRLRCLRTCLRDDAEGVEYSSDRAIHGLPSGLHP